MHFEFFFDKTNYYFRPSKETRLDVDEEDDQESYFKAREDLPLLAYPDDEEEMEYDSDGNPIPPERSKVSGRP